MAADTSFRIALHVKEMNTQLARMPYELSLHHALFNWPLASILTEFKRVNTFVPFVLQTESGALKAQVKGSENKRKFHSYTIPSLGTLTWLLPSYLSADR